MVVLPCKHKYCPQCYQAWYEADLKQYPVTLNPKAYHCQACWTTYEMPVQGPSGLLQNYQVVELENQMLQMNMKPTYVSDYSYQAGSCHYYWVNIE